MDNADGAAGGVRAAELAKPKPALLPPAALAAEGDLVGPALLPLVPKPPPVGAGAGGMLDGDLGGILDGDLAAEVDALTPP